MQAKDAACFLVATIAMAMTGAGPNPAGGTITGKVTFEGMRPKLKPMDKSKEPTCAKMCTTTPLAETVLTGSGSMLANVVFLLSPTQSPDVYPFYIELGAQMFRSPDNGRQVLSKVVMDLRDDNIYGFRL